MVVDVTRVEYTTLNVVESKIYRYPFVVPAYIRLPVLFHDIADTVNGLYIYQSSSARAKYIIFFFSYRDDCSSPSRESKESFVICARPLERSTTYGALCISAAAKTKLMNVNIGTSR